jgi:tRNA(Ile)-lysidine synthase
LLPQLAREWNPEIVGALARVAEQAASDEAYWTAELDRLAVERFKAACGAVILDAGTVGDLPDAVARRLIRRAVEMAKGDLRGVDFRHVDDVLRLARSSGGSGRVQMPGMEVCRSFDSLRFGRPVSGGYRFYASVPGVSPIPGTNRALSLELIENSGTSAVSGNVYNSEMGLVDWGRVSGLLTLRSWAPGDRYRPMASPGVKKLRTLFQLARIPSWERIHWPVLVDGNQIVWTRRFGPAAEYVPGPQSSRLLRIRETEAT